MAKHESSLLPLGRRCPKGADEGADPTQGEMERTGMQARVVPSEVSKAMRGLFKSFATTARLMVGVPDYDTYVRHRQDMHPGEPIMSYEDFFRERQDSRYGVNGGKISRCC